MLLLLHHQPLSPTADSSSAIDVKTSNLESIACKGLKSSGSEVPIGCDFRNHTHSWFVELDCVSSDLPIALSACYGVPHHSDVSGAHQQTTHIPWSSRWSCRRKSITKYTHTCINICICIPALRVVKFSEADMLEVLNTAVTVAM